MRRRRLRRWAKWTCTLAAGAAVALVVVSRFYPCGCMDVSNAGPDVREVNLGAGLIWARHYRPIGPTYWPDGVQVRKLYIDEWCWGLSTESPGLGFDGLWHAGVLYDNAPFDLWVGVSLLYPVALTLIPAALLWYADRRPFGPGLCPKCSYDRRGLAPDAKCPECGTVPAPAAK
jgi:hypothetical protein